MEILKILAACLAYAAIMWVILSVFILALIGGGLLCWRFWILHLDG